MFLKLLYIDFDLPYLLKNENYPVGGTAVEWNNWIKGFLKIGIDISLLTWKGAKNFINQKTDFDIIEAYDIEKGIPKLRIFYYQIPKLYKAIKRSNATHVIQQNAGILSGTLAFICKLQNKKFVYRVGSDIDAGINVKKKLGRFINCFFQYALHNANLLLCQNMYQYELLKNRFPNKRVEILYNPFVINNENIINNSERKHISWIGNFRPVKNLPLLYEIALKLPNINFKVAGKEFSNIDKITASVIYKLKQLENVEFVGYLNEDEIQNLLSKSYFLLNTSLYEGLSNTFIEALSVGTPVVTTKNANPDNIISNNKLGFVYQNSDDIRKIIIRLLNNFDYCVFRKKSIKFVQANFDYINQANKLLEILNNK